MARFLHWLDVEAPSGEVDELSAAARLQARVALEELLARCPDFHVDVATGQYAQGAYVRRHVSLPWSVSG